MQWNEELFAPFEILPLDKQFSLNSFFKAENGDYRVLFCFCLYVCLFVCLFGFFFVLFCFVFFGGGSLGKCPP